MLFSIIGRLYFWLVLVPYLHKWVTPVLLDIVANFADKQLENLTPEQQASLDRAKRRRNASSES